MLLFFSGLAQAQLQAATPYELSLIHKHCGKKVPFVNVRVKIELKKGDARQQVVADVISCLSKQDDRLVSIMCDVATEKCDVSRERDEDTPAIEETLRQLRQQPAQQNKI